MHGGEQWAGSEELQSGLPRSGMWEAAPGRPYTLREWQNKVSAAWSGIWVATCKHHELSLLGKKKKKKLRLQAYICLRFQMVRGGGGMYKCQLSKMNGSHRKPNVGSET